MFGVVYGLDDEPIVPREVEERPRLAWRAEFREDVLGREGQQVVGRIKVEV